MDRELYALRSLIPDGAKPNKSDLEVVLEAIAYIRSLEDKLLSTQSSPALLKARYLTVHRMSQQQCEL